jgi:hypothetical protein
MHYSEPMKPKPKFDFLLELMNIYRNQALRCEKVKAYLAGCVFMVAALEAGLLAMTKINSAKVRLSQKYLGKPKKYRNVDKWSLGDLLILAREIGWIPAKIPGGDKLGSFAGQVKDIRNLIHPGFYVRKMKDRKITKQHFEACYNNTADLIGYLGRKVEESIVKSRAFREWEASQTA